MSYKKEFDSFLDKIRPFIKEYLSEKGINVTKNFKCINPEHDDSSPSMTVLQSEKNEHRCFCFGCHTGFDIFDTYAILENKPRHGPRWMKETVLPLAHKYGIEVPTIELSTEDQFRHDLYRIYDVISSLLVHELSLFPEKTKQYVTSREWKQETLENLDIGVLDIKVLKERFSNEELDRFALNRPDLFNGENIIFTFRDWYGRPIKFFARRFSEDQSKWIQTSSSGLLVDLWRGYGHLYLSNLLDRKSGLAVVVEGQGDAVTLYQNGFKNIVASCGTGNFSELQADSLIMRGISEICLMYDGDEAGWESLDRILRSNYVKESGIRYSIAQVPEGDDPDSFLRKHGAESVKNLIGMRLSSFEYLLSKQNPSGDIEEVVKVLIPHIAASSSEISREIMARQLSEFIGNKISVSAIINDVKRIDQRVVSALLEKEKAIVNAASRQAQQNVEQSKEIFRDALKQLEDVEKENGYGGDLRVSLLARVQSNKNWEERERGTPGDFTFGSGRFDNLEDILAGGRYSSGKMVLVGAVENMGKTSFINNLAWQLVNKEDNQVRLFIQTLDDPTEDIIARLVCSAYASIHGSPDLTMNMVTNPKHHYDMGVNNVYEMREEGYARVLQLINEGRLLIKDVSDGQTVAYAETQLQQLRRNYPDDNIVYLLDNFHNASDWSNLEARSRYTNLSKYVNNLTKIYHCLAICNAEYRKQDPAKIGTNEDLAEARALKYDAKLIMHLYTDVNVKGGAENAKYVHRFNDKYFPRIICRVSKNKITDRKGDLFYDFYPGSSQFYSVTKDQFLHDLKERKMELQEQESYLDNDEDNDNEL